MQLTTEEAQALAKALAEVQRHYPGAKFLSDKHMAVVGLAVCCGRIYAPRAAIVLGVTTRPAQHEHAKAEVQPGPIVVDGPVEGWFPNAANVQ